LEIKKVLDANPDKVATYRAGKVGLLGFFVGQVMKATQGKADPKAIKTLLAEQLGEPAAQE
jgi:glutaminyl-tRNA synthetase